MMGILEFNAELWIFYDGDIGVQCRALDFHRIFYSKKFFILDLEENSP
jgi:hypothetical protein